MYLSNLIIFITAILLWCITDSNCKRHTIYWDASIEPKLKDELRLEVQVNDWMDILCPHKTGFNRSSPDRTGYYLEMYNVTAEHYKHCAVTGQRRLLHCKDPRQETKLTTKFQLRSPSPIGFVFRTGQTYYYLSKPMHSDHHGCGGGTLRMAVKVKEKNDFGKDSSISDAAAIPKRLNSNQGSTSYFRYHHHRQSVKENKKSSSATSLAPSSGKKNPGNSSLSSLNKHSLKSTSAIALISLLLYFTATNQLFA